MQEDLRNELTEIYDINYAMETVVNLKIDNQMYKAGQDCTVEHSDYDSCVHVLTLEALQGKCLPVFLNNTNKKISTCSNNEEGMEAFSMFQKHSNKCRHSCKRTKVKLNMHPINVLYTLSNTNADVNMIKPGFYFHLPLRVLQSEMHASYGFVSFIGEFGGWMGLLLGASVVGTWIYCSNKLSNVVGTKNTTILNRAVILTCTVGISIIIYACMMKLMHVDVGMDISVQDQFSNISLSVCSDVNAYTKFVRRRPVKEPVYIGNTTEFWKDATSLHLKLSSIVILFKSGESIEIYNSGINKTTNYIPYSVNMPKYGKIIESCHTIDLEQWSIRIKSVQLKPLKEITVYIHTTGQLLNMDTRQGFSLANRNTAVTSKKSNGMMYLFSSETTVNIEKYTKTKIMDSSYNSSFTYDQCIIDHIASIAKKENVTEFIKSRENIDFSSGILEETFQNVQEAILGLNEIDKCRYPTEFSFTTLNQQKNSRRTSILENISKYGPTKGKLLLYVF